MTLEMTLVGGPTFLISLGGRRILVDPTFDPPQTYTGKGTEGTNGMTKTVAPALSTDELAPIDTVLITHDHHIDHLDYAGEELVKSIDDVYTTVEGAERLGNGVVGLGAFEEATVPLADGRQLTIIGVPAQHGPDPIWKLAGPCNGFVLRGEGLPTVYISGDNSSVEWAEDIAERVGPVDVAFMFGGGARFPEIYDNALITMANEDSATVAKLFDAKTIVPVHTEGWDHFLEDAESMRLAFEAAGLGERVVMVKPGETVTLRA